VQHNSYHSELTASAGKVMGEAASKGNKGRIFFSGIINRYKI
jgi:hypothetical protein